jgi:hypothetical protein
MPKKQQCLYNATLIDFDSIKINSLEEESIDSIIVWVIAPDMKSCIEKLEKKYKKYTIDNIGLVASEEPKSTDKTNILLF